MKITLTKRDFVWGYVSQIIQFGSGLLILPLILHKLSASEVGIWYVFMAITGLVSLLDFGFSPIIMRNVSYVFSGAKKIEKQGIDINQQLGQLDYTLLFTLIKTSQQLYRIISLISFVLISSLGSIYIYSLTKSILPSLQSSIIISWAIFAIGAVLNLYFAYYLPLLQGRGFIMQANKTMVISKLFYIIFAYILLILGFGLIGIASCYLLSSLISRVLANKYFYTNDINLEFSKLNYKEIRIYPTLRILWFNSSKLGLNAVGSFLILQANTILCSSFLGLEETARYGITIQVFSVLCSFSLIFFNTYIPLFNHQRILNDTIKLQKSFALANFIGISVFITGFIFIFFAGDWSLRIIGSNIHFLKKEMISLIGIYLLLNMIHGIAASFITTKNEVPFVKATLASGAAITLLSYVLLKFSEVQTWAIIFPPFLIGLLYNNWKWPLIVAKDFKTNYFKLLKIGMQEFSILIKRNINEFTKFKK